MGKAWDVQDTKRWPAWCLPQVQPHDGVPEPQQSEPSASFLDSQETPEEVNSVLRKHGRRMAASSFLMRVCNKMECVKAQARGLGHRPACLRVWDRVAVKGLCPGHLRLAQVQQLCPKGLVWWGFSRRFYLYFCFFSFKCCEWGERELSFNVKTRFVNPWRERLERVWEPPGREV